MKVVDISGVCLQEDHAWKLKKFVDAFVVYEDMPADDKEIVKRIADADIIISALTKIPANVISKPPNLKMICLATTGYNGIDLEAAKKRGIKICYAPGYATRAVAEHAIGLMLTAGRLSFCASQDLKAGIYNHRCYQGKQLQGKTLGVIGYGRIGREVAKIAHGGFDMTIMSLDKGKSRGDFEKLLKMSDFISLHLPLTSETKNILGRKEFKLMKKGSVLVNTARGGLIDEIALLEHLKSGKIFAAGLDVLKNEPMRSDNPLLKVSSVCISPHISYTTEEAIYERSRITIENVIKFIQGHPQNLVEGDVL